MTDDFKDRPQSITEIRAHKTRDARDWTPRDALIDTLRRIDSGELNIDTIFIAFSVEHDKITETQFVTSGPGFHKTLGVTTRALHLFNLARDRE